MGKEIRKNIYSIIVIFLFILSIGFAFATFHLIGVLNQPNQTYVGTIAISNYEENQYSSIIASNLNDWKDDSNYTISYQNFKVDINFDYFEADIDLTINQLEENEINSLVYSITDANKNLFEQNLSTNFTTDIITLIDLDSLLEDIFADIEIMSVLNNYDLINYFDDGVENTILSSSTMINLDNNDVTNITSKIVSLGIKKESRFYLLEEINGITLTNNQLSIIASGIQAVTMNSNLNAFIFEQNNILPSWGQEGMNVRILQTNTYDFSFYNDFDYSMSINITKNDDNSITFELIGYPFVCSYATINSEVTEVDFGTIYENNDTIDETTLGVITIETDDEYTYQLLSQVGVNGKIIKFEKTITYPDASTQTIILYYEEYEATAEIYQENVISKDGE